MLIESNGQFHTDAVSQSFTLGTNEHLYSGFFYIPGYHAGEESVQYVQKTLEETGKIPFGDMHGNFVYCIRRKNGEQMLFSSSSHMGCIYISDYAASTGFAEHLRFLNSVGVPLTFQTDALCEYYTLGMIYFEKTLVEPINLIPNDCYIRVSSGTMEILSKNIEGIDGRSSLTDPQEFFVHLAHAISGERVAQAVTGGYDSRMLFAQLNNRAEVTPFISTSRPKGGEYTISQKVAEAGGKQLLLIEEEAIKLTESLFRQALDELDWEPPFDLSSFSILHFNHVLHDKGFNLGFSGDGGVLHKDWEWMQDLPFYHCRHTNLRKFYHQRIAFAQNNSALGPRLSDLFRQQEEYMLCRLQPYVKSINTQSYDFLYYHASGNRRRSYNRHSRHYSFYAPLLELDLLRYSYHLPRRKRFFYNFLREMTTVANPNIARLPTIYGTTASSEPLYILRDIFFQLVDYSKKAVRMFGRKLLHKNFFNLNEHQQFSKDELLSLPLTSRAVSWATSEGLLQPGTVPESLAMGQLAHIIHIYLLADTFHVDVNKNQPQEH